MAFRASNVQRDLTPSKILEELQKNKQLLLKQGVAASLNSAPSSSLGSNNSNSESQSMTSNQRTALQTANQQSTGFFISQDSLFGNLILPVLPRFDAKP